MTPDQPPQIPRAPKHVRARDRTGRRCQATHPTREVRAEGILQPFRCRLVWDHGPSPLDPNIEGHWSYDGQMVSEW